MATEIVYSINVNGGEAGKSLKSLREEFKQTQTELNNLVVGSKEYVQTLQKLGGLRDEIGDLNATINAFNPEGKVQALGNAIGGVASGFQAAVGATALFGSESENLNKALLKVQATMAFVEGIKGIVAAGDAFQVLNTIIAANPFIAIATGIILALTTIVGIIKNQQAEEQKLQKLRTENTKKRLKELRDEHNEQMKFMEDLAKAQGKSNEEIYKLERENLLKRREENRKLHNDKKLTNREYADESVKITRELALLDANYNTKVREESEKTYKKKVEDEKKLKDALNESRREAQLLYEKITEDENKVIQDTQEKQKEFTKKFIDDELQNRKRSLEEEKTFKLQQLKEEYMNTTGTAEALDAYKREKQQISDEYDKKIADDKEKKDKEAKEKREKDLEDFKKIQAEQFEVQRNYLNAAQGLSEFVFSARLSKVKKGSKEEEEVLKKQFEVSKAFQLAQAAMAGAQSILAITSVPDFTLGIATASRIAVQVALTAAQIAKIASTKFTPTGGGGTENAPSQIGGTTTINTGAGVPLAQPQATQLLPNGTVAPNQNQNNTFRAVVVESDITNTQRRVSNTQKIATIE